MLSNISDSGECSKDYTEVTMIVLNKKQRATKYSENCTISLISYTAEMVPKVQSDSLARGPKKFGKSIPEFGEKHSSVLGCERRPVSASIMSRSCFASFPICIYKFSSHYLNNIIFIDNSLGPLATESPCTWKDRKDN